MSTPTNIPETPMSETEQDSFFESKEKFQHQLQDIFQTILRLTGPDHFDQLCQWMEYKQYHSIDDFYERSYDDLENFDTKGPARIQMEREDEPPLSNCCPKTEMFCKMDDT